MGFLQWHQLRRFVLWTLAVAVVVHMGALFATPSTVMALTMKRLADRGVALAQDSLNIGTAAYPDAARAIIAKGGSNVALLLPRVDHTQQNLVPSTPDFLYAVCIYDLSIGPIRIKAPNRGGYVSVSAYADNSDNFFGVDDQRAAGDRIEVTLMRPGWESLVTGRNVVSSPSTRGIVLVRILIEDEARLDRYLKQQSEVTCGPIGAPRL